MLPFFVPAGPWDANQPNWCEDKRDNLIFLCNAKKPWCGKVVHHLCLTGTPTKEYHKTSRGLRERPTVAKGKLISMELKARSKSLPRERTQGVDQGKYQADGVKFDKKLAKKRKYLRKKFAEQNKKEKKVKRGQPNTHYIVITTIENLDNILLVLRKDTEY